MPIVHAEADYFAPLTVDTEISIHLFLSGIKTTSFTMGYEIYVKEELVGKASIVHVVIDKETKQKRAIPEELHALFQKMPTSPTLLSSV